ncbi:MAG: cysteine desulfurase [Flavobacteriaceae bacterium]|nr:cysteine desulfurase [Flavobacteriaceae bacterium]
MLDVKRIRKDFPILNRLVNEKKLIYFDNAATSQTPKQVIDAISQYYFNNNSNVHRGVHFLSEEATSAFELSRNKIQEHFKISKSCQVIFTSGTTHSINIVASGYAQKLKKGDEIIVSELEHHSNIVPWQMLCERVGSKLRVIRMNSQGNLDIKSFEKILSKKTKLVFVNHVSNSLGTINPIEEIIFKAHKYGAKVIIDGAQAVPHFNLNLQKLDVDYYAFSAHKLYGPTGVGVLYGKEELLKDLPPYHGGGEMISNVTFEKTTYAEIPYKFEAGTPNISGVIGFGAALDYLNNIGFNNIISHEKELLKYATEKLNLINGLKIFGESINKTSVISFNVDEIHPYDIGLILDKMGIAVRTGKHCTQPIMDFYDIPGTVRVSFAFYNTFEEIDKLVFAINKAVNILK